MPSTHDLTRFSIIDGILDRDADRWRDFYAIYKPMLLGYFRKQGLKESDASDLIQDVFLKLLKKIHTYDRERTRFRTWLFTVARNTLIDQARRCLTQKQAIDGWVKEVLNAASDEEDRQREEFERSHHTRVLQFAFEKVRRRSSPRVWSCFELSVIKGLPGAEVARALDVTTNVVYVNSWRVLQAVKKVCHRYDEDLKHEPNDRMS
ncbi:RNA polymerase sigma factor [Paludisphaera mucosa]|uniref:Sigma-70 family RNA polymerase sigma factor n=1 Tax=Paludisphaera mucosa TaxID=3030827 RepID=A0ABT6FBK4_9BACT|nr:sigma-70 family RNA polymerase sigma factor [Paludisphaera mucosa]MDG3004974.1 sigma-70 family RNA polymerase sigma factor [Paludisphaera mucosa]